MNAESKWWAEINRDKSLVTQIFWPNANVKSHYKREKYTNYHLSQEKIIKIYAAVYIELCTISRMRTLPSCIC